VLVGAQGAEQLGKVDESALESGVLRLAGGQGIEDIRRRLRGGGCNGGGRWPGVDGRRGWWRRRKGLSYIGLRRQLGLGSVDRLGELRLGGRWMHLGGHRCGNRCGRSGRCFLWPGLLRSRRRWRLEEWRGRVGLWGGGGGCLDGRFPLGRCGVSRLLHRSRRLVLRDLLRRRRLEVGSGLDLSGHGVRLGGREVEGGIR
jgi:hypothetical protein